VSHPGDVPLEAPLSKPADLTPLEIAAGEAIDEGARPPRLPRPSGATPREALENALLAPLTRPPCVVAFSGGRDSSALLALAAGVARREGLPLPVPVTLRWSQVPGTDESEWQETVIRHLGLPEWDRLEIDDDLDLVGPTATERLLRLGLTWPPTVHVLDPMIREAAGGSLVTGEGGDDLFGGRAYGPVVHSLLGHRRPGRREARYLALAIAPPAIRRALLSRRRRPRYPWLTPLARDLLARAWAARDATEPVGWSKYASWVSRVGRRVQTRRWTSDLTAREHGCVIAEPLLDPGFVASIAEDAGHWAGYPDRTTAMRRLFGDLLPDELCSRPTKASFTNAFFNRHSRAFASTWSGDGVDLDLVIPDALRETWLGPHPHVAGFTLLQSAWLAGASGT